MELLISIGIRVAAAGYSVVLLRRAKDWRIGLFTLMLVLMAVQQALRLRGVPSELLGLAVSVLALVAMVVMDRLLVERQRVEESLRSREERLARIVETVPDGIAIVDSNGQITFANAAAERILGLTRSDITQRAYNAPAWKITTVDGGPFPDEDLPFSRVMRTGAPVYDVEHAIEHPDGTRVLLSINAAPLRDAAGEVVGMVASLNDITERKRAEEQLRESEQQLRLFVEHSPAAIAMFDRDMRYLVASRRWHSDYNIGDQPIIGRSHYDVFPDLPERWKGVHQRCLAGAIERCEEDPFPRADGYTDWVRWEVHPWRHASGEIGGIIIFSEVITERKQMEGALRESEARFRAIAANTPDHVLMQDRDLRYQLVINPQLGLTEADMMGRTDGDFLAQEDAERLTAIKRKVLETGEPVHLEVPVQNLKGETEFFEGAYIPQFDATGQTDGLIGYFRNVTDRKRAEEALREREAKFSAAFHSSPVALGIATLDGKLVEANRAFCEMIGYSREEIIGKTATDLGLLSAQDREKLVAAIESVGGSVGNAEVKFHVRDGSVRDVLYSLQPISLHGVPHRLSTGIDITDRKRAEEVIKEHQRQLSTLISNLPGLVYRCRNDVNYTTEFVSDGVADLTGYPAEDFQQHRRHIGTMIHPDDQERVWTEVQTALRENQPFELTYRILTATGAEKWVWERGRGIHDTHGKLQVMEGFVTDITERKRAEEQLRDAHKQLQTLSRRLLDVQETERRTLARELHDDIGQFLTSIKLTLQAAYQQDDPAAVLRLCEDCGRVADEAMQQVRNLSLDLRPSMLDDLGLVPALRWYLDRQGQRVGLTMELTADPSLPRLPSPIETACFRIVQEAVNNVARHARATHVWVECHRWTENSC